MSINFINEHLAYAIIKKDAIDNGFSSNILNSFSEINLYILNNPVIIYPTKEQIAEFYKDHVDKPYYTNLEKSLSVCIPIVLQRWYAKGTAIEQLRYHVGTTDALNARPESIRGRWSGRLNGGEIAENAIHASDSFENLVREIKIIKPCDIIRYSTRGYMEYIAVNELP